jgi:hypothetical protein
MDAMIIKALKSDQTNIRLTNLNDHKWLVWDAETKEWVVYGRKPYARNSVCYINTADLNEAIEVLMWEED